MKRIVFLLVTVLQTAFLFGQAPTNDNCPPLDLGTAPACPTTVFSNVNATNTDIGFDNNPDCFNGGIAVRDVWFKFTCPLDQVDFRITLTGVGANTIENPQVAIYRGECVFDGLALYACVIADIGENELYIDLQGLTPGLEYFIRVSDYSTSATPNWGEFNLCVDSIPPISTIDQGSSALCNGTLYDSGGPDTDYGPDEDFVFTICPPAPTGCLTVTLEYFNIEEGGVGDALTFYDGPNIDGTQLTSISAGGFPNNTSAGGGVCFKVVAPSGCMTLQFQSDGTGEFEGFKANWSCSGEPCEPEEIMNINDQNLTFDTIENALESPLAVVTVTNINCPEGSYGTYSFATDDNDTQTKKGLILTSGSAVNALGPNDSGNIATLHFAPGDDDLDIISGVLGQESQDACIVELDVFAATDQLTFEYVFGSEEYPEFVGTNFNDIFAFLVSGPGIVGDPGLGGKKNIAKIPGTNTLVEINSVNNEDNWQYYRNNQIGQSIQYDGLTSDSLGIKKTLTAKTNVTPCNTYKLKLAIADRGDASYDSGVFISEITGGIPDIVAQFTGNIDYLIEGCSGSDNTILISLSEPLPTASTYIVEVSGTATPFVDYNMSIPATITFAPGQTQLSFPLAVISDLLAEGEETVTIALKNNFGCGDVTYKTLIFFIRDNLLVEVNNNQDTLLVCAGGTLQLNAEGAEVYFWTPPGAVSNAIIANPTITPTQDILLVVTGNVGACIDKDTVQVHIIAPSVEVASVNPNMCVGGSVLLTSTNNVEGEGLIWAPITGLNNATLPNPTASPSETIVYTASVTVAGCTVSDTVLVTVDTLFVPTLTTTDTTLCQNYPVVLANEVLESTTYLWSPTAGLSDPTASNPVALPDVNTTYTLTSTSANNICTQTSQIVVNVVAADLTIQGDDEIQICLGETVPLVAISTPTGGSNVVWTPNFAVSPTTGNNVSSTPDESVWLFSSYSVNGCNLKDSVFIRVDSLPINAITLVPAKPVYCPGDTILLKSTTYQPSDFPAMTTEWLPYGTQLTPDSNWNLIVIASLTHTYQRVLDNRGCSDTSEVLVNVAVITEISITGDPTICAGETSPLIATATPNATLKWEASPSLSCTDCPNPIASPTSTTTYMVKAEDVPCPAAATFTVTVSPAPAFNLVDSEICGGTGANVILNNVPADPNVTYSWTGTGGFASTEAGPTVTPNVTSTYVLTASNGGCTKTDSVKVEVRNASVSAGADVVVCAIPSVTTTLSATVTGNPGNTSFVWAPDSGSGQSTDVQPDISTTYTVTLNYGPNCTTSDQVIVTVNPNPTLSALNVVPNADTSPVCIGTTLTLSVVATPANTPLAWTENGNALTQTGSSITVSPNAEKDDEFVYTVTATTSDGCTSTATDDVTFEECFDIPNAFSPNGDDNNNTFSYINDDPSITIQDFKVFNRWGGIVFDDTIGEKAWDGKVNGSDAPIDVYYYLINVKYANGTTEVKKGEVTLLR